MARDYPPPPWRLNATAYISVWRIPLDRFTGMFGSRIRPIKIGRNVLAAAGFIAYERGSDVEYDELFLTVLARAEDGQAGLTVPLIWVDSPLSLRAGRELWAIPKQLATFKGSGDTTLVAAEGMTERPIAQLRFRKGVALPFRVPLRATVLQEMAGTLRRTPIAASTSLAFGRADWAIPEGSALQLLRSDQPVFSLTLRNARIRFGA